VREERIFLFFQENEEEAKRREREDHRHHRHHHRTQHARATESTLSRRFVSNTSAPVASPYRKDTITIEEDLKTVTQCGHARIPLDQCALENETERRTLISLFAPTSVMITLHSVERRVAARRRRRNSMPDNGGVLRAERRRSEPMDLRRSLVGQKEGSKLSIQCGKYYSQRLSFKQFAVQTHACRALRSSEHLAHFAQSGIS